MTPSHDVLAAWRAHLLTALAEHIAQAVGEHLPDGDDVVVTGTHLVLTRRRGNGPARTVVTHELTPPHPSDPLERTAEQVLDDLQDMVIGTLHRPWPGTGGALHPRAGRDGDRIELAFAGRDGAGGVVLPPFPVPPEPERAVGAG